MYLSIACGERSRPKPDCLKPPNGVASDERSNALTQTVPARIARESLMGRVHVARPDGGGEAVDGALAFSIASASLSKGMTTTTGPKISS